MTLRGLSEAALAPGAEAWLTVRPEAIELPGGRGAGRPQRGQRNRADAVYAGSVLRLHVALPGGKPVVGERRPPSTVATNGAAVTLAWPVEQGRCVGD